MKENAAAKNGYRVSFSYLKSPTEKHSVDKQQLLQKNYLTVVELGGKKERTSLRKNTETYSNTHSFHHSEEQTLKK